MGHLLAEESVDLGQLSQAFSITHLLEYKSFKIKTLP